LLPQPGKFVFFLSLPAGWAGLQEKLYDLSGFAQHQINTLKTKLLDHNQRKINYSAFPPKY
jgi:hypothetical protein